MRLGRVLELDHFLPNGGGRKPENTSNSVPRFESFPRRWMVSDKIRERSPLKKWVLRDTGTLVILEQLQPRSGTLS